MRAFAFWSTSSYVVARLLYACVELVHREIADRRELSEESGFVRRTALSEGAAKLVELTSSVVLAIV